MEILLCGGVLYGVSFFYNHDHYEQDNAPLNHLILAKGSYSIKFLDEPAASKVRQDKADVDEVPILFGSSNFYEIPGITNPSKQLTQKEEWHRIFSDWTKN